MKYNIDKLQKKLMKIFKYITLIALIISSKLITDPRLIEVRAISAEPLTFYNTYVDFVDRSPVNDVLSRYENTETSAIEVTKHEQDHHEKFDWQSHLCDHSRDNEIAQLDYANRIQSKESESSTRKKNLKKRVARVLQHETTGTPFDDKDDFLFYLKAKKIDLKQKLEYGKYPDIKIDISKAGNFEFKIKESEKKGSKGWYGFFGKQSANDFNNREILDLFLNFRCYELKSYREFLKEFPAYDFFITLIAKEFYSNDLFKAQIREINSLTSFIRKESQNVENKEIAKFERKAEKAESSWLSVQKCDEPKSENSSKDTDQDSVVTDKTANNSELEQFKEDISLKDAKLIDIHKMRLEAVDAIFTNPKVTIEKYYITPILENYLNENSIDPKIFQQLKGNQAQHQIHSELLAISEDSAQLYDDNQTHQSLRDIAATTMKFTTLGMQANQEGVTTLSYYCANAGHCILAFAKGAGKSLLNNTEFLRKIALEPDKAGEEIYVMAKNVVFAVSKVSLFLLKMPVDVVINRDKIVDNYVEPTINLAKGLYSHIYKKVANIPNMSKEQIFEKVGHTLTDVGFNFFVVPKALRYGAYAAQLDLLIESQKGSKVLGKLGAIGQEAAKIVGSTTKKGADKVLKAIDKVAELSYLHNPKNSLYKTIDKTVNRMQLLSNYLVANKKYADKLALTPSFKKFYERTKLPTTLMFNRAGLMATKLHEATNNVKQKIHYYIDKLGNIIKIPVLAPEGIEIQLSKIARRTFGWLNEKAFKTGKMTLQELPKELNVAKQIVSDVWDMPIGGKMINGRFYTQHALERMAPRTPTVLAELEKRALEKYPIHKLPFETVADKNIYRETYKQYKKYIDPRNIPPCVVEDVIKNGIKQNGSTPNTFKCILSDIEIIINEKGSVVTVI